MTTQFANKWLILGIDLLTIAVSFILAYFIRFNLSLNFDMSLLVLQLPIIVLLALLAFLITGSYKVVLGQNGDWGVNRIFQAIGLSGLLIILLVIVNSYFQIYPEFSIPLSIIIIYSLLSFVALTGTHYAFKVLHNAIIHKSFK